MGDIITHANGKAVVDMKSPEEFIDLLKDRPLRLTVDIVTSPNEFREAIGQYDWSSKFDAIKKAEIAKSSIGGDTNAIFERVFQQGTTPDDRSPLFDAKEWIDARAIPPPQANTSKAQTSSVSNPQFVLVEKPTSKPSSSLPLPPNKVGVSNNAAPAGKLNMAGPNYSAPGPVVTEKVVKKWIPSEPVKVYVNIVQGFDLPPKAGVFQSDYIIQPFRSEPYFELLIAEVPSGVDPDDIPLEYILATEPIKGDNCRLETAICDSNQRWNFSTTFSLPANIHYDAISGYLLIGRLMDYRRLSPSKAMGLFAVQLNTMDILKSGTLAKPKLLSLSSADSMAFDVTKTRVKASICIIGDEIEVKEQVSIPPTTVRESSVDEKIVSPTLVTPVSLEQAAEPTITEVIPQQTEPVSETHEEEDESQLTPFQRAYRKARAQARNGDFTSLHNQNYTLRNYD